MRGALGAWVGSIPPASPMSMSKSIVHNAGKRDPKLPRTLWVNGERRGERYPSGVAERFVDLQGNTVTIQMIPPGIPQTQDDLARKRNQLHTRKNHDRTVTGFVEHDKCPLRHGTRHLAGLIDEFAEMPQDLQAPCTGDPRVLTRSARGLEMHDPCPHVQWLIGSRRSRELERRESRRSNHPDYQAEQLTLAKEQAADSRRVADKLSDVVEALADKSTRRKSTAE